MTAPNCGSDKWGRGNIVKSDIAQNKITAQMGAPRCFEEPPILGKSHL